MSFPILSIDQEASIQHPDNLMVFIGRMNLQNVYEEDGKYFVDTIMGKLILMDEAVKQYCAYKKFIDTFEDSDDYLESNYTYLLRDVKKNGFRAETRFTTREILYFDMSYTI